MYIGCYGYVNALEAFHFVHISYLVSFVLSVCLSFSVFCSLSLLPSVVFLYIIKIFPLPSMLITLRMTRKFRSNCVCVWARARSRASVLFST